MPVDFRAAAPVDPVAITRLARQSRDLIADLQDSGGAYPACPTFSAYRGYAWLRDGSFTAEGMSRLGASESADRFHDWVAQVITARSDRIAEVVRTARDGQDPDPSVLLPTRFTLDGADGTEPWWDFQTDGYGTWLWSVTAHARRHSRRLAQWLPAIELCIDYLSAVGGRACYDWWEEHSEQRHTSTLSAVYGGLRAAADIEELDDEWRKRAQAAASEIRNDLITTAVDSSGSLVKWIGSEAVDGSLPAAIVPFGLVAVGGRTAHATLQRVTNELGVGGGVNRFLADEFYGGGQWPLLSCLLGWNLAVAGERDLALERLLWTVSTAETDGHLPEQVPSRLVNPAHRQEWLDKWGPVASPLLWSHGMYLILADELDLLEGI